MRDCDRTLLTTVNAYAIIVIKIQEKLSDCMYGDDVFRFFRNFHPNSEQHISDILQNCKSLNLITFSLQNCEQASRSLLLSH